MLRTPIAFAFLLSLASAVTTVSLIMPIPTEGAALTTGSVKKCPLVDVMRAGAPALDTACLMGTREFDRTTYDTRPE